VCIQYISVSVFNVRVNRNVVPTSKPENFYN